MIENMINLAKEYLPLKVCEIRWDGSIFHMNGPNWSFNTMSVWRISKDFQMVIGCYDTDVELFMNSLVDTSIMQISIQENLLKIDPVFTFSDAHKLEIFSTDTYEPWTFFIDELGLFSATPSEPNKFDPGKK